MSDQIQKLKVALGGRYRLERELGAGGMAFSRQPAANSRQRLRGSVEWRVLHV